jgi:hypothetical protein
MNHVEGPLRILLVGKEGQPYLTSNISSFSFFFHFFFEFYIGVEGKHGVMDNIERRERGFLLHWLYIGVCT